MLPEPSNIAQTVMGRKRVVPQPEDRLYPGGDCGACVLAGLFDMSVADAYKHFNEDKQEPIRYHQMIQALWTADGMGLADRVQTATPIWPIPVVLTAWGFPGGEMAHHWFNYVRMAFEAGYYAIALVDIEKRGSLGGGTNHWVLLCGARERYGLPGAGETDNRIYQEVLVSCSASSTPAEEWVDCIEFLEHRGGYNLLLVRPT